MPTIVNNESLLDEGKRFGEELSSVEQNLNNDLMYQANDEISKHVEELDEAKLKLSLSLKLMKIEKLLGKIKLYNEMKKYAEISSTINAIQLLVNDPEDRIIRRLDMYQNLKARIATERDNMLRNLEKRFHDMVHIKAKSFLKTRAITMKITKDNVKLAASANAIIDTDYNFQSLADSFMNNIFEPVISRAVSLEIGENEQSFSLSLSYSTEVITDELRPNYGAVFANLRNILSFLLNMNVQLKTGDYFLAYIFDSHRQQLQELIFNNCLAHSIPKTFEEMNQCTMKADITKLSQLFAESNFFSESSEPQLEDYAAKVDELFYQEFTKTIQASVSELLKRDLHDMMLIDEDSTLSTTTPLTFPRSMVSKSTLELIRLLEKIIKQTDDANNQSNLMMSIRSVLENYTFTIQLHHSKFMSKIPQQSALFYNNCMYLSNWVSTIREMSNCKMDHLTSSLESQGWEVLECQIAKQKIQLLEILSAFGELEVEKILGIYEILKIFQSTMEILLKPSELTKTPSRSIARPQRSDSRALQADPSVPAAVGAAEERLANDSISRDVQQDDLKLVGRDELGSDQESSADGGHFDDIGERVGGADPNHRRQGSVAVRGRHERSKRRHQLAEVAAPSIPAGRVACRHHQQLEVGSSLAVLQGRRSQTNDSCLVPKHRPTLQSAFVDRLKIFYFHISLVQHNIERTRK